MSSAVVVFLVCVVACAIAHAAIVVSSLSARAAMTANSTVPRPNIVVEVVWALIPIFALALVFTATYAHVRDREKHPPETMKVAS